MELALTVHEKPVATVYDWHVTALNLIRAEIKDPQNQARVLLHSYRVLCRPYGVGEHMAVDRYAFKGTAKTYKARVGKYRLYYQVDNHVVTLTEVVGRKDAYTKAGVTGRQHSKAHQHA